jgi:hypothetical protein
LARQILKANLLSLTTLWAFIECGLGSILHALHVPITGLVLGGFSVIVIYLIAYNSKLVFKEVMAAFTVIAAIKLLANPATSPFAYLALGFQALLGGILYSISTNSFIIHLVFAVTAMIESAAQKIFVMVLFMQKNFWIAFDAWVKSTCSQFNITFDGSASTIFAGFYLLIFIFWGILLAVLIARLPKLTEKRLAFYASLKFDTMQSDASGKSGKKQISFFIVIACLALLSYFLLPLNQFLVTLLRAIVFIAVWQILIVPIWRRKSAKWLQQKTSNSNFSLVQEQLMDFRQTANALWLQLGTHYSGVRKLFEFVLALIFYSTTRKLEHG